MQRYYIAVLALSFLVSGAGIAQTTEDHTNRDANKAAQRQTEQDRKVEKTQAHADKKTNEALKSKKVKKADKAQDKANTEAEKASQQR